MTVFVPSTTVRLERGEGVDAFGDAVDNATVVESGIPAAVSEGSNIPSSNRARQRAYQPNEQRGGIAEVYTIRLRPNSTVQEQDRLVDERNGITYVVVDVFNPQSGIGAADVRLIANRVSARSQPVNG